MPKMPRTLDSLLEAGFADGYDAFREIVEYTNDAASLPRDLKAWIRFYELISVAMIEAMNRVETDFEVPPTDAIVHLWNATGAALASVNAQAFVARGMPAVRRMMTAELKRAYDKALKGFTEGVEQ